MKTYIIHQKLIQTDCYSIEAESAEEALKKYMDCPGVCESNGSVGGWPFGDKTQVVAVNSEDENDFDIICDPPKGHRRKK